MKSTSPLSEISNEPPGVFVYVVITWMEPFSLAFLIVRTVDAIFFFYISNKLNRSVFWSEQHLELTTAYFPRFVTVYVTVT